VCLLPAACWQAENSSSRTEEEPLRHLRIHASDAHAGPAGERRRLGLRSRTSPEAVGNYALQSKEASKVNLRRWVAGLLVLVGVESADGSDGGQLTGKTSPGLSAHELRGICPGA
jgi:hypothetical protein